MDGACVDECPVDCIYEGGRALYIHADECVDCGACEPVCPVDAIYYEDDLPDDLPLHLADNDAFFAETLPGRDVPLGSPGGAGEVGPLGVDTPLVAARPSAAHSGGAAKTRSVRDPVKPQKFQDSSSGESAGRRRAVMQLLRASADPMSIAAIADVLGVHPNTVRFHLDSLVADGQVERVEMDRKGPGRPPLMFRAVRQMDRGGTRHYRLLAEILAIAFAAERDPGPKALAAGRAWGRQINAELQPLPDDNATAEGAIAHLIDVLDELGFAPERRVTDGQQQVGLRHCPFLELAESRSSVVCPVHLGLMQGAMESWGALVSVDRLDTLVEPDLCLAHLTLQGAAK